MTKPFSRIQQRRAAGSMCLAIGIALLLPTSQLQAQSNDAEAQTFDAIEEVIVHARKRAENVQDVPQSVSAFHKVDIENAIARDLLDLENISPNLVIDRVTAAPGAAAISMRGISFQDLEKSFDPSVGVVLDGVFLGTNTGQEMKTIDLERVEVLRGPQGTVFGKNSIAGVINLVRADPTGEFGAKVRARIGDYERSEFEGVFNFPLITDTLVGKFIYASQRQGEGFWENVTSNESLNPDNTGFPEYLADGDEAPEVDYESYTFDLLYTPSDELSIEWVYQREEDESDTGALLNYSAPTDFLCILFQECGLQGGLAPSTGDKFDFEQNFDDYQFINLDAHTFQIDYDLAEDHALTYIFGRRSSREQTNQDFDGSPANFFSTIRAQSYFQDSHELRLDGSFGDSLEYVAGVYFWDAGFKLDQRTFFLLQALINPLADPRAFQQAYTDHDSEATAVFFEADYYITDDFSVILGARYTEEEKSMGRWGANILPQPDGSVTEEVTLDLMATPTKERWTELSPKVGFKYDFGDFVYYGYLSSGFRSGGMNGRANSLKTAQATFDPETVNNLELGYKSTWLNNRLRFNAALFFQRYKDKQEELVIPALTGSFQETVTINAAEANIDGMEIEIIAIPQPYWQIFFNAGLLDAEYDSFDVIVNEGEDPTDYTVLADGKTERELRRAPEYTWSMRNTFSFPMGPGTAVFQLNYRYKDDFRTTFNNIDAGQVDGHGILDAALFYRMPNWSVSLYGKNLTDEDEVGAALDVAGLFTFVGVRPPRIFGLEFTYDWKGSDD